MGRLTPYFSLIIPTSEPNRRELLVQTLSLANKHFSEKTTEIVIVENGFQPREAEQLGVFFKELNRVYPNLEIKVFSLTRKSASKARNLGVKKSRGDFLVFLDDDCIPTQGWFKKIRELAKLPSKAAFQGEIIHQFKKRNIFVDIFNFWLDFSWKTTGLNENLRPTKFVHTGNLMVKKEILEDLDYVFDEALFPFIGEEWDLAIRLKRNGVSIFYVPEMTVRHVKKGRTLVETFKKAFLYGRKEGILIEKYPLEPLRQKVLEKDIKRLKKQIEKKNREVFFRLMKKWLAKKTFIYRTRFVFFLSLRQLFFWIGFIYGRVFYKFYRSFRE